jgi:hypothetical protein
MRESKDPREKARLAAFGRWAHDAFASFRPFDLPVNYFLISQISL